MIFSVQDSGLKIILENYKQTCEFKTVSISNIFINKKSQGRKLSAKKNTYLL